MTQHASQTLGRRAAYVLAAATWLAPMPHTPASCHVSLSRRLC
jgi:hypothetical protein